MAPHLRGKYYVAGVNIPWGMGIVEVHKFVHKYFLDSRCQNHELLEKFSIQKYICGDPNRDWNKIWFYTLSMPFDTTPHEGQRLAKIHQEKLIEADQIFQNETTYRMIGYMHNWYKHVYLNDDTWETTKYGIERIDRETSDSENSNSETYYQ